MALLKMWNGSAWVTVEADVAAGHPAGDGNLHLPATGTSSNGMALIAGPTAGSFAWVLMPFPNAIQVLVDFGINQDSVTTTVSAAWVMSGSVIVCTPAAVATADHDAEDAFVEGLQAYPANIVAGVSFDVITYAPAGSWGRYYINCIEV